MDTKKYIVKNITRKPAVPIGLMCQPCGGSLGSDSYVQTVPGVSMELTEEQYEGAKEAIDRYVKAEKLKLTIKEVTADKKEKVIEEPEFASEDEEKEAEIRKRAKKAGIKSWHVKSVENLEKELAEKEG